MSLTESSDATIGSPAPPFSLPEPLSGSSIALDSFRQSPLLIVFMCNHCPYVVHILDGLIQTAADVNALGIKTVGISANDVTTHPADSPEKMAELARAKNFPFPYLYDESQQVARTYGAVCTPDIFLYDAQHKLYYRGQFDSSRPGSSTPVTGESVRNAVDAMLREEPAPQDQIASVGCSIKWKAA